MQAIVDAQHLTLSVSLYTCIYNTYLHVNMYHILHISTYGHPLDLSQNIIITAVASSEEPASVQHQILTATVKMFLKVPQAVAQMSQMVTDCTRNIIGLVYGKIDKPEAMFFHSP